MTSKRFMNLDEMHINKSWQPTPADYAAALPEEDNLNEKLNYGRIAEDLVTLVTGASYGIGYKIAEVFAQHGAKVIMVARHMEALEKAKADILAKFPDSKLELYVADVTDKEATVKLFAHIKETYGRLDTLINNAGVGDFYICDTATDEVIDDYVEVNLKAPMRYCREALKIMLEQNYGNIVNVSSVNGTRPLCGHIYSGAKGGLNTYTKAIAMRCVGTGVHANCLCPGYTVTPASLRQEKNNDNSTEHGVDYLGILHSKSTRNVPTFPVDQANLALFLGTDLSRAITGQIIIADNGQYL